MQEFRDIFALSYEDIKNSSIDFTHEIILPPGTRPIHLRNYRHTPDMERDIQEIVDQMEQSGICSKSSSPWSFPLLLIRNESTNKKRVVVDLRMLNKLLVPQSFPLIDYTDVSQTLGSKKPKYFSSIDLF